MSVGSQNIRQWIEEYTGDLNEPNMWRLYAKLEESPKTFPLMVLRFLDEFSSCFSVNVAYNIDVLSIDYNREIDLGELLTVSELLHSTWLECQHIEVMKNFSGILIDALGAATLEFIADGGPEWIFDEGPFSEHYARGNCGQKIEQLRWDLWNECERNRKIQNSSDSNPLKAVDTTKTKTGRSSSDKTGTVTEANRKAVQDEIERYRLNNNGTHPTFDGIRKATKLSGGKITLIFNERREIGEWAPIPRKPKNS